MRDLTWGYKFWATAALYALATTVVTILIQPLTHPWGFQPGYVGTLAAVVVAAPVTALAVMPFGVWRRVNRARLRSCWRREHAIHVFMTSGRIAGIFGVALLAEAIQLADRWPALQDTWDRSVPFGIVIAVFLGAGISESLRKLFPAFGVIAAILIALPIVAEGHGSWRHMIPPAVALLAVGGLILVTGISLFPPPRSEKDLAGAGFLLVWLFAFLVLGAVVMAWVSGSGAAAGLWTAGFTSAVLLAAVLEMPLAAASTRLPAGTPEAG